MRANSSSFLSASLGLLCILCAGSAFCQDGSLSGKVINSKTGEVIPFATIFLANTMLGTRASAEGAYQIQKIPSGKYDLTVSSVGYSLATIPLVVSGTAQLMDIKLDPEVKVLKQVEFKLSRSLYLRLKLEFKKYFLGETANATKCKILNLDDVTLQYDEEDKVLTAYNDEAIEIENEATGYRIFYLLKEFRVDFKKGFCVMAGIPRFDTLHPKNSTERKRWQRERDRAYHGSINHFMRSLKSMKLKENNFTVYLMQPIPAGIEGPTTEVRNNAWYALIPIGESEILAEKENSFMQMKIVYNAEAEEFNYVNKNSRFAKPQTSYIKFIKHPLVIHDNGYYENPFSYYIDGYFAWSEKIAELLPREYKPATK